MYIKNIAFIGAGGKVGSFLVPSLVGSTNPKFIVTAILRPSSTYSPPADYASQLNVIKVDLDDHAALVEALKGQDALLIAISGRHESAPASIKYINAAIEAGVKLVLPSEYGTDETPELSGLLHSKRVVKEYLEKQAAENKITYSLVRNGAFSDLIIQYSPKLDLQSKTALIFDAGNHKAHFTTTDSICKAVITILSNPTPFTNRVVHFHDFFLTQQDVVDAAESVTGEKFNVHKIDIEQAGKAAVEKLKSGDWAMQNISIVFAWSAWGEVSEARWDEDDDSVALGLEPKDLKEEVRKFLNRTAA